MTFVRQFCEGILGVKVGENFHIVREMNEIDVNFFINEDGDIMYYSNNGILHKSVSFSLNDIIKGKILIKILPPIPTDGEIYWALSSQNCTLKLVRITYNSKDFEHFLLNKAGLLFTTFKTAKEKIKELMEEELKGYELAGDVKC